MDQDKTGGSPPPEVREAIDASDNEVLGHDPAHADGKADIAVDESFPASDPPAHNPGGSEPAPSSGFDKHAEAKRQRIAERAHGLWEKEGRPEGQDIEHWLRAEAEDAEGEEGA